MHNVIAAPTTRELLRLLLPAKPNCLMLLSFLERALKHFVVQLRVKDVFGFFDFLDSFSLPDKFVCISNIPQLLRPG